VLVLRSIVLIAGLLLVTSLSPSAGYAAQFTEGRAPTIRRENVVIVYDHRSGREEIFWEMLFDGVPEPFGWLIPLPAGAEVEVLPFGLMGEFTRRYPLRRPKAKASGGYRHLEVPGGSSRRRRLARKPTWILPTAEVFPGAATEAVAARLARLDMAASVPKGAGTIVLLHVHLASAARARVAVRLGFSTDRPVFPYAEPVDLGGEARQLTAWLIAPTPYELIARAGDGAVVRPWRARDRHRASRAAVRAALGVHRDRLPGQGQLWIQTFVDRKADRTGYGPIVGVPDTWAGADLARVREALGPSLRDPLFARVAAGQGALSELPLRDRPRRRIVVQKADGAPPPRCRRSDHGARLLQLWIDRRRPSRHGVHGGG